MFRTHIDYEGHHPITEYKGSAKPGMKWCGDGIDFRCYYIAKERKDVEIWLQGVKSMQKLLRATLTKGK